MITSGLFKARKVIRSGPIVKTMSAKSLKGKGNFQDVAIKNVESNRRLLLEEIIYEYCTC